MNNSFYYTGIGSRETPEHVCKQMQNFAYDMAKQGHILRSGHADGADWAFESGVLEYLKVIVDEFNTTRRGNAGSVPNAEIYTPWRDFKNKSSNTDSIFAVPLEHIEYPIIVEAADIVKRIHGKWNRLTDGAKKMHTRNVFQVLGKNLNEPSKFVLYWANENAFGEVSGGTRTAVMLARERGIPTINMKHTNWRTKLSFILDL